MIIFKKSTIVKKILFKYANVMQQVENSSCGLFTIMHAINTAFGIDPKKKKKLIITNVTFF
jgi:hypothetical protein